MLSDGKKKTVAENKHIDNYYIKQDIQKILYSLALGN